MGLGGILPTFFEFVNAFKSKEIVLIETTDGNESSPINMASFLLGNFTMTSFSLGDFSIPFLFLPWIIFLKLK